MTRSIHGMPIIVAAFLAATVLAACGGGGDAAESVARFPSENDVAQVGSHLITRAMLNEWMTADIGSDYYEVAKRRVPAGLVSEPVSYPTCTAVLKGIESARKNEPQPSAEGLRAKCEVLYDAIKEQTLTFLVGAYWDIAFAAEHGLSVANGEVQRTVEQVKAKDYPKPGQFEASLRLRRRTLSQERFLAEVDILQSKLKPRISSKNKEYAKLQSEARSLTDDAICRAEYVVTHCKEPANIYTGPSPTALVHELAQ
jgi:hypothetical protein